MRVIHVFTSYHDDYKTSFPFIILTEFDFVTDEQPKTIKAHRSMLICASPVFEAMFCGPLQENGDIEVSDIDSETFMQMLK